MLGYGERHEPPEVRRGADGRARTWNGASSEWLEDAPRLECDWEPLKATYRRSLVDLAALRFSPLVAGRSSLPAAGLPWFMTMFGRDSILTSLQALPFAPELAATTLRALGAAAGNAGRRLPRRGSRPDPPRDALRGADGVRGAAALAVLRLRGRHAALRRAARRVRAVDRRQEARARARVRGPGGAALDRRVRRPPGQRLHLATSVATRRPDSRTSAGRTPGTRSPTATAGFPASRARPASSRATPTTRRCAAPGWRAQVWKDPAFADQLEKQAAELKRRFNRDFWVEDDEYFALALDADGKQVDALTSNNGHLLWSGIVDKSKAKAVVRHLMGPRLFSGWGVRTLAEGEGRYNPIGYHVGTVWPFDNSFIAWGLRRYGFKDEAARIAAGILDAAEFFDGRLPEAFGGYDADDDEVSRCSTRPRAALRRGRPARRCCCCARCSASSRSATTSSSIRRSRPASDTSSCSTSRAAGDGSTPSGAAAST